MKNATNEHSFTSVTHMAYSDTRLDHYGFLKLGHSAELFWTAWTLERNPSFRGAQNEWIWTRLDYGFRSLLAQLFNAYSNT
jgi:hypothetical protein